MRITVGLWESSLRQNSLTSFRYCAGWNGFRPAQFFYSRLRHTWMILFVTVIVPSSTFAQPPKVTITGGADQAGTRYKWTVTNHYSSPIVYIEFPHYRANLFFVPDGWFTDESTNLVTAGEAIKPGICVARSPSEESGITYQQEGIFRIQLSDGKVKRQQGQVALQFADGKAVFIHGVELPHRESLGDRYISLIGLFLIFILFLTVQLIKYYSSRKQTKEGLPSS